VAEEHERKGNAALALSEYRRIRQSYPASEEFQPALLNAIELLASQKRFPEAIALVDTQLVKGASAPLTYAPNLVLRKADLLLDAGDASGAQTTAERFITDYPKDARIPNAHYLVGRALVASGDSERGKSKYHIIIDSFPTADAAAFSYLQLARLEAKEQHVNEASRLYTTAFDERYFSSDAAPIAMAEYAAFLRATVSLPDSALHVYDAITARYLIETSAGSNAQFEAAEILQEQGKTGAAATRLERIAQSRKGERTGGEARLQLAGLYRRQGERKNALIEYDKARKGNPLTPTQLGRSLMGSAEMYYATGNKRSAQRTLQELLATRGLPRQYRVQAQELLNKIAPKQKVKRKR
jgi:TolA-binding protein